MPAGNENGVANGHQSTPEDYIPQNILVTGGAGFIASHVVIRLLNIYSNYKVRPQQHPGTNPPQPPQQPIDLNQ